MLTCHCVSSTWKCDCEMWSLLWFHIWKTPWTLKTHHGPFSQTRPFGLIWLTSNGVNRTLARSKSRDFCTLFYFQTRVQGTFAYLPSLGYTEAPFTLKASYARNRFPIPVQLTRHTSQFWIRSPMNTLWESGQRLLVMFTCSPKSCVYV